MVICSNMKHHFLAQKTSNTMKIYKSPIMMSMLALFLILVGATIYRIITALETHPGLVVENAYESGENYATTLSQKQQLANKGWKLDIILPENIKHNIEQTYQAIASNNYQLSTKNAKAVIYFYRPLEKSYDFSMPMPLENNIYQVEVTLPLKGRWDIIVEIQKDDFVQRSAKKIFAN